MKASELRQSILQAAVQGKLVPQDLHDEPASKLLERIRAEKTKLVKEGKIKKEKPLPPIAEDEIPYDLPEGWSVCRLNEIVSKVGSGSTPSGGRNVYVSNGVKFLRSQNVYNDSLRLNDVAYITQDIHQKMSNTYVYPKDILLNITGASIGRCCIVPDDFDTGNVNQHVSIIRCIAPELRFYLHVFLTSPFLQKEIMDQQVGMSREGLSGEKIKKFVVPVPPYREQQRIVAKVDELMALCDELEAAENELEALEEHFIEYLPKSILQAAVQGKLVPQDLHDEPASEQLERVRMEKARLIKEGKLKKEKPLPPITEDEIPYDLPEGWIWCRLGDACIVNPRNQLPDDIDVAFTPMPLISSEYFGGHGQEARKWGNIKSGFTHYAENDVVVAKITPCFQNGKSCVMKGLTNGFGAGTTELHVLRCIEIVPEYLLIYVKNPSFLIDGEMNMTGTAGQQRVPTDYLKSYLLPVPPVEEQQRIVTKVNELIALCNELKIAKSQPVKRAETKIALFPHVTELDEEIGVAARGDATQPYSPKLQGAISKLLKGDPHE